MKVVFLITALDYSGGPKMMAWVANQFCKAGHDVTFISVYSDKIGQPLEQGIKFVSLDLVKSKSRLVRNTIEMIKVQRIVGKEINRINPDVVMGFLYSVDYFYTLFNVNKKRKIVLSQRLDPYIEKGISAKIKAQIIGKADGVVFQSDGARDYYNECIRKKSCVIPNPVTDKTLSYKKDVSNFENREDIIVLPARLNIAQKRQDVMINAFEIVVKEFPEMKLVLLGDGPDKDELEKCVVEKNLSENVVFHSAVKSAEEYVRKCKIMCLTSDFEGLPNSLIEAMALGVNVVATDCSPGGARMLIQDGKNGYLVGRGDYRALADRICRLLNDSNLANQISGEAVKIADTYSEDVIAKKWIKYVETIV